MFKILHVILITLAVTLVGCKETITAEQVAVRFLEAIYVEKNVEKAKELSEPELRELLTHYHTSSMVQRHVVGLTVDNPTFDIIDSTSDFLKKLSSKVEIQILFDGTFDHEIVRDERTLVIVKSGQTWKVKEIVPDKFMTGG